MQRNKWNRKIDWIEKDNVYFQDERIEKYDENITWGDAVITPSKIYSNFVLSLIGRFKEKRNIDVHGIVHMTGGGMHNLFRIIKGCDLGFMILDL